MADTPFFDPFDNGHLFPPAAAASVSSASPYGHFGHAPAPSAPHPSSLNLNAVSHHASTPTSLPPSFPAPPSSSSAASHSAFAHTRDGPRLSTGPLPRHHLMRTKRRYDQVSPYSSTSSLSTTTDDDADDDSSFVGDLGDSNDTLDDFMDTDTGYAAPQPNRHQKHKRRRLVSSPPNPSVPAPLPSDSAFNNPHLPPAYYSVLSRQLDGFHISDGSTRPPALHQHISYTDSNAVIRAARHEAQVRSAAAAHEQAQAARHTYQGTNSMLRELHRQRCLARGLPVPEDDDDEEEEEEDGDE